MDTEQILDEFTGRQGWDDNTALDLALRYIENQGSPDAWRDFLAEIASEENAGSEFADDAEPDDDDLAWAREDLGPDAPEDQVRQVAERRAGERAADEDAAPHEVR